MYSSFENLPKIIRLIKDGKIGVIPTDTIYGIIGSALIPDTVEKIYRIRKRSKSKPFIILISSINDLNHFNVQLTEKQIKFLKMLWPNPVSVVLSNLAFRMPKDPWLRKLLEQTGPLVAPSANIAGKKPAETIKEAKKYFGNEVDFYVDGGKIKSKASTLVQLNEDGTFIVLRKGGYRV